MMDYTNLLRMLKTYEDGYGLYLDAAAAIEALQAQLPKRGEWIWIQKENGGQYKGCSVCHAPIPTDSMLDYLDDEDCDFCYSCGAKMEVRE